MKNNKNTIYAVHCDAHGTIYHRLDVVNPCAPENTPKLFYLIIIIIIIILSEDTFFQTYLLSWSDSFGDVPEALPTIQSVWDRPGIAADRALVESNLEHLSNLPRFEPHRRHTVEIGCLRCP